MLGTGTVNCSSGARDPLDPPEAGLSLMASTYPPQEARCWCCPDEDFPEGCRIEGDVVRGRSVRRPTRAAGSEGPGRPLAQDQEETTMTEYLITFNDEWVPEHTEDEIKAKGGGQQGGGARDAGAGRPHLHQRRPRRVDTAVCSVVAEDGKPVFTDGPYVETKEHLGGFCVVDVPDDETARYWAGRLAVALEWPQEVHRFRGAGMARTRRLRAGVSAMAQIPAVRLRTGRAQRVRQLRLQGGDGGGVRRDRRLQRQAAAPTATGSSPVGSSRRRPRPSSTARARRR